MRALYSSIYPLVIVDEFQDTNTDQWRVIKAVSGASTVIGLADPDQRIFDHLDGVEEQRLDDAVAHLAPTPSTCPRTTTAVPAADSSTTPMPS
ncbi:UvrD-helicase domain-containing protein [Streptomyces sp. L7]